MGEINKHQRIAVIIGVLLAMLLSALDQTIVATAMPKIVEDLNGLQYLSWVTTAYLLTSTIMIPVSGKFSDIFGRKRIFLIGIIVFLAGSFLSGASQTIGFLILCRAFQGIGAGVISAIAFTLIGDLFPPSERGKWQGLFGGVFALASVIGPILGGWLTDNASWRWNFYINMPVGILALIVMIFLMPNLGGNDNKNKIDYPGIASLVVCITTLLLALVWGGTEYPWASTQIFALMLASFISLTYFMYVEDRSPDPLLPLTLFKNQIFTVSSIITFFLSMSLFGAILYIPLFAQSVLGVTATNSGTILMPLVGAMITTSIICGQLISRRGKYKLIAIIGLAVVCLGLFALSTLTVTSTKSELIIRMIFLGLGLGACNPIFTLAVQNSFDHSKLATATSSIQLFRNIGSTVGSAVMGSIMNNVLESKLAAISNTQSLKYLEKISPSFSSNKLNIDSIQQLLNSSFQSLTGSKYRLIPPKQSSIILHKFSILVLNIKSAISSAITEIFLITVFLMLFAFFCSFFLEEIPLRKTQDEKPANDM